MENPINNLLSSGKGFAAVADPHIAAVPNTGDNSLAALWIILLLISLALILFALFAGKKKKHAPQHLKKKK